MMISDVCFDLVWRHCALGRLLVKLMLGIAMGGSGLMWSNYERGI